MAKYNRDELARLETSLRDIARSTIDGVPLPESHIEDLEKTADFLVETIGVLDRQKSNARRRAAQEVIEKRRRQRREGWRKK